MARKSMYSSGETALATSDDTAVTAIQYPTATQGWMRVMKNAVVTNEGSEAGFVSVDGGATWIRLPASYTLILRSIRISDSVLIKRVAGGANLSGVFVSIW